MKRLLEQKTRGRVLVEVGPFAEGYVSDGLSTPGSEPRAGFVYIASGEAHKNHERLLEAWELRFFAGLVPSLRLTLDERRYPAPCRELRGVRAKKVCGYQASAPSRYPVRAI